jgi:hexosaminidase
MRKKLVALVVLGACQSLALSLLPTPSDIKLEEGNCFIQSPLTVNGPARLTQYTSDLFGRTLAIQVLPFSAQKAQVIFKNSRRAGPDAEAYDLRISPQGIEIEASSNSGSIYGLATLWQILSESNVGNSSGRIPCLSIHDNPRFAWRGVLIDSARHFQSIGTLKKIIEAMALHKMNVLHWHLVDDQAWRLEIKKYPNLALVGGYRVPAGPAAAHDIDPATGRVRLYGGYYSQDQVRDLVDYASFLGVTIVPEIEMPGHSTAAQVAYPGIAASPHPPTTVPSDWGVFQNLYSVDDKTFLFLQDVLDEVMQLFPSHFIHVGGDEAVKNQWQNSPQAQAVMQKWGLQSEDQLQAWFIQRINSYLQSKGRRLIGWDEILAPGLSNNAAIMSWHGSEAAVKAARQGFDAVLTPDPELYFDDVMNTSEEEPPGNSAKTRSLQYVYQFQLPTGLTAQENGHILGIENALWAEHMRTEEQLQKMMFPRQLAVAELAWSHTPRDWQQFLARIPAGQERLRSLNIPFSDSPFEPFFHTTILSGQKSFTLSLDNQTGFGEIRYTLDGSEPGTGSTLFVQEIALPLPSTVKAATFSGGVRISDVHQRVFDQLSARERTSFALESCDPNGYIANVEDDAPLVGPRAVFRVDLLNPCWIYRSADLTEISALSAKVGQIPFSFKMDNVSVNTKSLQPLSGGVLEVRLDSCNGDLVASFSLDPALGNEAVTSLQDSPISGISGIHDLCYQFSQRSQDLLWTLKSVGLVPKGLVTQ